MKMVPLDAGPLDMSTFRTLEIMAPISVIRIGPFLDGSETASQLRFVLLRHFRTLPKSNDGKGQAPPPTGIEHQFFISNRYFNAQIALPKLGDSFKITDSCTEDGIILAFDLLQVNSHDATSTFTSFDALQSAHEQAEVNETAGDLLRLCVGVGDCKELLQRISEKEYEKEYSRRVLWCLDRGYEYVEADLSEDGVTNGHDARDKEGFARIVEAIAGTVWSSAIMEKSSRRERTEPNADVRQSTAATDVASSDAQTNSGEIGTYEPPDPSVLPSLLGDKVAELERERLARDSLLAEEISAAPNAIMDANSSQREDLKHERALNALEQSMNEARRLREQSMAGQLSDDERRKRAGDAALLIMNMMEQMGIDDEESDEDFDVEDGKE